MSTANQPNDALYRVLAYLQLHVGPYGATLRTVAAGVGMTQEQAMPVLRDLIRRGLACYAPTTFPELRIRPVKVAGDDDHGV